MAVPQSLLEETLEAWRELYELMASAMKQAAAEGGIPRP